MTSILATGLGAVESVRVGEVEELPVGGAGAEPVVVVSGAGGGGAEASATVTRATMPVPGSVVSHFCTPSLR